MEKNIINSGQCKTQSEVLEKMEIKIRTPLTGIFFQDDRPKQYNGFYKDGTILSGMELVRYEDAIQEAVDRENGLEEGTVCNLMEYFDGSVSVKEKVKQVAVSVENVGCILYGCTTLQVQGKLEADELQEFCEYITAQYNDGWGEGFGQRDIQVKGGKLNVHFKQEGIPAFWVQAGKGKNPVGRTSR